MVVEGENISNILHRISTQSFLAAVYLLSQSFQFQPPMQSQKEGDHHKDLMRNLEIRNYLLSFYPFSKYQ